MGIVEYLPVGVQAERTRRPVGIADRAQGQFVLLGIQIRELDILVTGNSNKENRSFLIGLCHFAFLSS